MIQKLLKAAMHAPSGWNQQPWQFVLIDKATLVKKIPQICSHAEMSLKAPLSILVCGDLTLDKFQDYWFLDCSAASQNILLAAHAMQLGAVWCGIYPKKKYVEGFQQLCKLPKEIIPLSLIVVGYPSESKKQEDRFIK